MASQSWESWHQISEEEVMRIWERSTGVYYTVEGEEINDPVLCLLLRGCD